MPIRNPIDLNGSSVIQGWQGESCSLEYGPNNVPFTTCYPTLVPISGSTNNELYVFAPIHTSSLTGSSGFVLYGSASDGKLYPIATKLCEDGSGQYALKVDTELILSGNIWVSNVKVFSSDGTSGSLKYGRVQSGTDYLFGIPVDVSGNFLTVTRVDGESGAAFVTSSEQYALWTTSSVAYPVFTNLYSGSNGANITPTGRLYVTSSQVESLYTALVALSESTYYTASIDAYNDLHVYDWRVSASLSQSNDLLTQISGAIVAETVATYAVSGAVVADTVAVYAASGAIDAGTVAIYATSGSVVATYPFLTDISGTIIQVSSSVDAGTVATYATSGSVVANTVAVYATSGSVVANTSAVYTVSSSISESITVTKMATLMSMFKYQLGVDQGTYANSASAGIVLVYGNPYITGSTLCPYIYNVTDKTLHTVIEPINTASFGITPTITTATASLIIKYNAPEYAYNQLAQGYNIFNTNPEYAHYNGPILFISESNGAMGLTTSSDFYVLPYNCFNIQFRISNVTCSLSATLSDETVVNPLDWYPITEELTGGSAVITASVAYGNTMIDRDTPIKYRQLRINYWKTNATNSTVVRYILY